MTGKDHVVALCGGVGGAKLAFGLSRVLTPDRLTLVVNTGDDFKHLGLTISPDIDTVIYTLADLSDRVRGWGLAGETWQFMDALRSLGGETWFNLGDRDLATHIERTRRLSLGESLTQVTAALARAQGIAPTILPMSDDPVSTVLETEQGTLSFQHYFVRDQCNPEVRAIRFDGASEARIAPALSTLLTSDKVGGVVICPSNPWLSIDPILAVPAMTSALRQAKVPVVAVSPIVGGAAIKGPTAKLMGELGLGVDQGVIAEHYRGVADMLLIDKRDAAEAEEVTAAGLVPRLGRTLMTTDDERIALAREVLDVLGIST